MITIDLSSDFATYPMGRDDNDGPDNGQKFYRQFILPNLKSNTKMRIVLDGVLSLGSSFLDEAFHIMPKESGFSRKTLEQLITIVAETSEFKFYKMMADSLINKVPK